MLRAGGHIRRWVLFTLSFFGTFSGIMLFRFFKIIHTFGMFFILVNFFFAMCYHV